MYHGYIIFKFTNIPRKEKRRVAENIVGLERNHIASVEFSRTYKYAAVRFRVSKKQKVNEILNEIKNLNGIEENPVDIEYVNKLKPFGYKTRNYL